MTKKDKELLMKDLCARLLYGVKCDWNGKAYELVEIDIKRGLVYIFRYDWIEPTSLPYSIPRGDEIKPYLRPMSSMTEEEKMYVNELIYDKDGLFLSPIPTWVINECDIDKYIDFCNSNHLDWRGLIPMGLALPAPEGMYNF